MDQSASFITAYNNEQRKNLGLKNDEYLVLLFIKEQIINPSNNGWCFISKKQISYYLDISEREVYRALAVLHEKGLIERFEKTPLIRYTQKAYDCLIGIPTAKMADHMPKWQTPFSPLSPTPPITPISPKKHLGSKNPNRGDPDVDQVLKEFSELTGYSQPTDRKPRQWAHLFAKHKGIEKFRPCLEFLLKVKGYDINKLETVYRKFPVFEAEYVPPKTEGPKSHVEWVDGRPVVYES